MSTEPGSDPIGDFQRWLMKAGAKSIGRDVADRVRSTVGGRQNTHASVWETATTEDPVDEPPECQWCPICRAARRYRDGGGSSPTLSGQFAGVGDTLAGLTRDAFSLFESAMRTPPRSAASRPGASGPSAPSAPSSGPSPSPQQRGSGGAGRTGQDRATGRAADSTSGSAASDRAASGSAAADSAASGGADSASPVPDSAASDNGTVVGPGIGWPTVVHSKHEDYEAGHERGHREEGRETGDGGADGGTDEQVERTAE
jgi:hypothetical protein